MQQLVAITVGVGKYNDEKRMTLELEKCNLKKKESMISKCYSSKSS